MNFKGNNLIFGLASGYNYGVLSPLIKTLKATSFSGDIVLFISKTSNKTIDALKAQGVILIEYDEHYPYFASDNVLLQHVPANLNGKYLSPNSLRYVLYRSFLNEYKDNYNWILHTDTRDVIFQLDPFSFFSDSGLYCFLEDDSCKIKDNKHNSYWIKFGFGELVFNEMKDEQISCSGVTLGTSEEFCEYLDKQVQYICELPNTGGLDQGIHNFLIFKKLIKGLNLISDDCGPVTTLTTFKPFEKIIFNHKGQIVNAANQPFNIVHQYDRHLSLLWRFNKKAFVEKSFNLMKRMVLEALGKKFD